MCAGCQPDNEERGVGVAKSGHRFAPVFLVAKGAPARAGDFFAPGGQAGAISAGQKALVVLGKIHSVSLALTVSNSAARFFNSQDGRTSTTLTATTTRKVLM